MATEDSFLIGTLFNMLEENDMTNLETNSQHIVTTHVDYKKLVIFTKEPDTIYRIREANNSNHTSLPNH